ncbi:hypothetical protein Tco_0634832 [Tanacetum coccineum]
MTIESSCPSSLESEPLISCLFSSTNGDTKDCQGHVKEIMNSGGNRQEFWFDGLLGEGAELHGNARTIRTRISHIFRKDCTGRQVPCLSLEDKEVNKARDIVMSDLDDSTVTYTEVSSPFEGLADIRSPGVVGPEYEGLPWMLDDPYVQVVLQVPPSPDYVPGLEEPEQAP